MKDQLTEDDVVVIVIHDHGSRYVGKIYNDDWMRERGFLDTELRVKDVISKKNDKQFFSVETGDTVKHTFNIMKDNDISQMPVMQNGEIVGSITESMVLTHLLENPMHHAEQLVEKIMGEPFPMVDEELPFTQLGKYISKKIPAVIAKDKAGEIHILTKYDIIQAV
jgi:cystathionine beta-synthase